jgi:predicted nucleic acid-binding protein
MILLDRLLDKLNVVEADVYSNSENDAKQRLVNRDLNDWPIVAVALTFGCAVWTEDADFFGTGIATWTSDRVEIFLRSFPSGESATTLD